MMALIGILKIGQTVVTYNQWTGFQGGELGRCFNAISKEEAMNLKPGDLVWKDCEPYHHHGKVYGYTLLEIKKVEEGKFHHTRGWFTIDSLHKLKKLTPENELKLIDLIRKHGDISLNIGY